MKSVLWALKDILGWRRSLAWWLAVAVMGAVIDSFLSVLFPAMLITRLMDAVSAKNLICFVLAFCGAWTLAKVGSRYAGSVIDNSDLSLTIRYGARISRATLDIPYAQWQTEHWRQREQRAKNAVENNSTDAMILLSTLKGLAIGVLGLAVYAGTLSKLHPAVVVLLILGCIVNLKVTAAVQRRV